MTTLSTVEKKPKSKVNVSDFQVEWGLKKNSEPKVDNGFDNVFGNQLAKSTFMEPLFPGPFASKQSN